LFKDKANYITWDVKVFKTISIRKQFLHILWYFAYFVVFYIFLWYSVFSIKENSFRTNLIDFDFSVRFRHWARKVTLVDQWMGNFFDTFCNFILFCFAFFNFISFFEFSMKLSSVKQDGKRLNFFTRPNFKWNDRKKNRQTYIRTDNKRKPTNRH
jgi:hypothetical protein